MGFTRKYTRLRPLTDRNASPTCPHPSQPFFQYWKAPITDDHPRLAVPEEDELKCLNLSLTIPKASAINPDRKIPVLVFIHGGAFIGGSHAIQVSGREVFDGADLSRHSMRIGKDIIVVGINYRVGPLGFLTSAELITYGKSCGDKDVANYGLHDQRQALQWLFKFIAGFGGDPDNITIQGTSAGSASCHYHTILPDRKFKRAILASGTFFGFGPRPLSDHQQLFDRVSQTVCHNKSANHKEALAALLSCSTRELTHSLHWDICYPLIDDFYITRKHLSGDFSGSDLPDTMIGGTSFESQATMPFFLNPTPSKIISDPALKEQIVRLCSANYMLSHFPELPFGCPSILKSYGLTKTLQTPSQDIHGWNHLVGSLMFNIAAIYTALSIQRNEPACRVWLFEYANTNTYLNNHSYRTAHHGVNDLFLFNPAPDQIPFDDQDSWNAGVQQTQRSWIEFVNGESPWQPLRRESRAENPAAIGPVFHFEDYGSSRVYETLKDCIGIELTEQYESVLKASNLAPRP